MDKTKLIENAQALLATREASLQATLEEIALLEGTQAATPALQLQLNKAIVAAKLKRDRQHNSCEATKGLITALSTKRAK